MRTFPAASRIVAPNVTFRPTTTLAVAGATVTVATGTWLTLIVAEAATPSIVAVIMNYVRRSDARGTYLESHVRWQLRTFWFAALWIGVIFLLSLPLFLVLVGFVTFPLGVMVAATGVE